VISFNLVADQPRQQQQTNLNYSNFVLDGHWLYASGLSYVLKLNASNISNLNDHRVHSKFVNATTTRNNIRLNQNATSHPINHIKYLNIRPDSDALIICATNQGKPHIYDLKPDDLSYHFEHDGSYLCTGVESRRSVALISSPFKSATTKTKTSHHLMYSATWLTSDNTGLFSRYGIYRKNIDVNDNFLRTMFSPHWLWVFYFFFDFILFV
jgi:hypothetical protein